MTTRANERGLPFFDFARLRIDAYQTIAVELGGPDRTVNRRVVDAVRSDSAGFTTTTSTLDLIGAEHLELFDLQRLGMDGEAGVGRCVGVPNQAFRIGGVDAKRVGIATAGSW